METPQEEPTLEEELERLRRRPTSPFVATISEWLDGYLHPAGSHSARQSFWLSWGVLGAVGFAYWLTRWPLADWPSTVPEIGLYLFQPIIWLGVAMLAGYGWLRLEERPRFSRLLTGFVFSLGVLHVTLLVVAGVIGSFADSPLIDGIFDYPLNLFHIATLLLAAEMARSFLFEVWRERDRVVAFTGVTLIFFVTALSAAELTPFDTLDDFLEVAGGRWIPALAISILATALVETGGPGSSLAYRLAITGFAWLSPSVLDLHWTVLALIGAVLPGVSWLVLSAVYGRTEEGRERPDEEPSAEEELGETGLGGVQPVVVLPGQESPEEKRAKERAERRRRRTRAVLTGVVMTTLLLVALYVLFGTGIAGFRTQIIDDASMEPSYERGDVVLIDDEVSLKSLNVDDVIRVARDDETVVRRIVAIQEDEDGLVFTTQADNLPGPDPPVTEGEVAGKVVVRIPNLGNVVMWWRD